VLAVLFGVLAGACFGALAVTVRIALRSGAEPEAGAAVASAVAFAISAALGLATWSTADPGQLWAFVLVGMLVPGASQIVFIMAVRDAGPSRAAILIGTAPLMSVLIALTLLGEPFHAALVAGTVLIVAGGAALTRERIRPHDFKALGAGLALLCAALFAVRDNLVRWVARDQHPPPLAAAAASLLGAMILLMLYAAVRGRNPMGRLRSAAVPFAPVGVALAGGYVCLLEALSRGRVSVVAPLNATQSLWAVAFAAIVLRATEAIGPRLVVTSVLIVAGGALIGIAR
jgi:drug/metabolite transporter (DMT)-like permease